LNIRLVESGPSKKIPPKLREPVLVCGLPGSAFVGKFAVDHLISELPGELFAEIFTGSFPPQVIVKEDGIASLIKNELYFWKNNDSRGSDLLLLTGDAQPATAEAEYSLSEYIIDYAVEEFHLAQLVTLGAYVTGSPTEKPPRVYSCASDPSLVERLRGAGSEPMGEGAITGMNGLLLGMAKLKGIGGYTLLGETSGYVFDPGASESVLEILSRLVAFNVDMKKLEERAKQAQEILRQVEILRTRGQREESQEQTGGAGGSGSRGRPNYIS
jgi:uncharacterized protein (TIGR00162 family)